MPLALGQRCYTPRASSNTLKLIVEEHLDELRQVYDDRFQATHGPLHPRVIDLFERFVRCGDPHFGFLLLECPDGHEERLVPHSCKARGLCPSCGKKRALAWAERMAESGLPEVPYAPLVFTIPKILRNAFKFDRKLHGELCRAAYSAIRTLLESRFEHLEKPVPAFVAAPQSFGSLLNFHPHVHGLSSLGAFDAHGEFHEDLDLDFSKAELLFREAVFKVLEKRGHLEPERMDMMRRWSHSGFRVHADRLIAPGNKTELESALEYIERPPVSLTRLRYFDSGMVVYEGKYHPTLRRSHQLLTGLEFLALLVPHIALRYEYRARTYGAASTTIRKRFGWIPDPKKPPSAANATEASMSAEREEESETPFQKRRRGNWARLIRKVWLQDPEVCSTCGQRMRVLASYSSPDQDDEIKRTLTQRGQWDPPWVPRAPPSPKSAAPAPGDRVIEYDVDPDLLWPDD